MEKKKLHTLLGLYSELDSVPSIQMEGTSPLCWEKLLTAFVNACYDAAGESAPGISSSVFWNPVHHDFFEETGEPNATIGLYESGEYITRGDLAYEQGLAALCETLFDTAHFRIYKMYSFFPDYYMDHAWDDTSGMMKQYREVTGKDELPGDPALAEAAIAASRTPYQFWKEAMPYDFVLDTDSLLKEEQAQEKLALFRDDFVSEASDDFASPLLFIWSRTVPQFLKWNRSGLKEEDLFVTEAADAALSAMDSYISDGLCTQDMLQNDEVVVWVYEFLDEESASYSGLSYGVSDLSPKFLLAPLVLTCCMEYLDRQYHFFRKEEVPAV